jgi:hypothetical protein
LLSSVLTWFTSKPEVPTVRPAVADVEAERAAVVDRRGHLRWRDGFVELGELV